MTDTLGADAGRANVSPAPMPSPQHSPAGFEWSKGRSGTLDDVSVRTDCRHYSTRTTASGEIVQRCRVGANETAPFACPDDCLFFEPRSITDAGWHRFDDT